ncbi:hypothetical protein RRG08_034912 [Elysia crispata]|uniref:Uncharacterized protein n=1 Tax=Elysia crispata TaxID=231223 RepID=A0AAE0YPV7_9GAST|nr:hypothetical protein RRG08_034912 [Elysia crispata]
MNICRVLNQARFLAYPPFRRLQIKDLTVMTTIMSHDLDQPTSSSGDSQNPEPVSLYTSHSIGCVHDTLCVTSQIKVTSNRPCLT